jgi:hypothetical protein
MIKKIVLSFVGVVVLAAVGSAAYYYYYPDVPPPEYTLNTSMPPGAQLAKPDNKVPAGSVSAVTTDSVTITKQDGTTATFSIASSTVILMPGQDTAAPAHKNASDIKTGMMVLVTPSQSNAAVVQSIVVVPAPPAQ